MTTSNEHNNAPAVPQGEPIAAWLKVKIEKHAMLAADCPGASSVVLKSSLLRFLDSLPSVAAAPAPAPAQDADRAMLEVIDERDRCHEWADELAAAIAKHTGYEIGEHTSANNPWRMALNSLVCHEAVPAQEAGLTEAQPMQPIILAGDGVIRFKKNKIVDDLYELGSKHGLSLNDMVFRDYSQEDRNQFAQLIGYSVSGWGGLSYAMGVDEADAIAALRAKESK